MTQAAGYPGFYLFGRTTVGWLVESHTADKTAAAGWSPTAYAQYYDPAQSNVDTKLVPLSQSVGGFGVASCGIKNPRGPTMAKQFNNSMYASNTVPCLCLCLCLCVRVSVCLCVRVFVCSCVVHEFVGGPHVHTSVSRMPVGLSFATLLLCSG